MTTRLATHVWVGALLKRADAAGVFTAVLRRGDPVAGAVILVQRSPSGGVAAWSRAVVGDKAAWAGAVEAGEQVAVDAYLSRQTRYDPDLWVVELVTRDIQPFIAELS